MRPILGRRLIEISKALLELEDSNANLIFGGPGRSEVLAVNNLVCSNVRQCPIFNKVCRNISSAKSIHTPQACWIANSVITLSSTIVDYSILFGF
jgi:hypothetical protein